MFQQKKEIPQGTVILQEKPFVYTLSSKFRSERCDFCFNKKELLKCSACRYVYYCDRFCQKEAWSIHKQECKNLKQISPRILPDAARILARLVRVLDSSGANKKSYYTETKYRTFKDLKSHCNDIKKDRARLEHFSTLHAVLQEYFQNDSFPNAAELMTMYGKMCVNSFSICNQELQSIGTGIYLAASIVDHSCKPTAVVTFEGTTLYMRTLEKLPYLDWSKVLVSYIDVLALTSERQYELETTYYFLCQCPKCIAPEPLVEMTGSVCPNSNCDNCIDIYNTEAEQTCCKCNTVITEDFIKNFNDVMEITQMHLNNMKKTTFHDACQECLAKHKGCLYKYNVKHVKIKNLAFDSSIECGKFDQATEYGLELIKSYYEYYDKFHPLTGLLHLKLGKLLLFQEQPKAAVEHLKKAKEILEITHGARSSIFMEHLLPLFQRAYLESQH